MRLIAAILCAVNITCASSHKKDTIVYVPYTWTSYDYPLKFKFICGFPKYNKAEVIASFQYWDDLVDYKLFKEVEECADRIEIMDYKNSDTIYIDWSRQYSPRSTNHLATASVNNENTRIISAKITFWRPWIISDNQAQRITTARHEIGHVLGLEHIKKQKACIMYPYIVHEDKFVKDVCDLEYKLFMEHYN